VKGW
jgi:hypothetical protein